MESLNLKPHQLSVRFPPHPAFKKVNHSQVGAVFFLLFTLSGEVAAVWGNFQTEQSGGKDKERGEGVRVADLPTWSWFYLPSCILRWLGRYHHPNHRPQASLSVLGQTICNQDLCSRPDFHQTVIQHMPVRVRC